MQQPNLTPEYKECIAHAGLYSISRNQNFIGYNELLLGLYHYIQQQWYASWLWELLGIKKQHWLQDYIREHYWDTHTISSSHNRQLMIDHTLQKNILSGEKKEGVISLLELVWWWIDNDLKTFLKGKRISYKKIYDRIKQLSVLLHEVGASPAELIVQLETIKHQHDIKLYDIDLQFLIDDNWENDLMSQLIQHKISTYPLQSNSDETDVIDHDNETSRSNNSTVTQGDDSKKKKLAIDHFGIDLTHQARTLNPDPVIGRDKETDQIIYTLLRKTKNNPLLVGEAWVWKTAIVEWLAQRIVAWQVPDKLADKRLIMIDMSTLVAWTKYRGEFEQRLKSILDEASDPVLNVILFIDEIHTLIWAWSAEWTAWDAAQMLKPALARWQIKVIWATTFDEYQKYIEKDAALKRRFQEVNVQEPSHEDTVAIIRWLKTRYEDFHGVIIDDDAITQAVVLSSRYVLTKHLPDKAIDLIDEACARKGVVTISEEHNQQYSLLSQQIQEIDITIETAVWEQDYFAAAELKKQQNNLKAQLQQLKWWNTIPHHLRPSIGVTDISNVLADKLGIPTHMLSESEIEKLQRLNSDLTKSLYGQDEVVQTITKAIKRSRLSVMQKNKPIASFLFLGPSGVGKTYTAKLIAKDYFNDEKALIRIDMSDLMERHSVSKLIGSAPGYVGYDEWWWLTEQVRRKPYSVLLFDEIEKASSDVLNIMLQILDEWQIKDNKWRRIDFKNTIIIMTSNIGSEYFWIKGAKIWFGVSEIGDINDDYNRIKDLVLDKTADHFSPEWLNRVDYKIVFRPLSKEILCHILRNQIDLLFDKRKTKNITLPEYNDDRIKSIVNEIYNPAYGARPIEQYVFDKVEEELIDQVIKTHQQSTRD